MTTSEIQIGQGCQHMDLAAVLGQATQPGFLKAELLLDHPGRMFNLGADMSFGGLDQILEPSIWRIRQAAAFAGPHRHSDLCCSTCHLGPFGDALVAR